MGPESIPTLEDRKLGEPMTDEGEPVVWDRMLPLLAQKVVDEGFDLPNPYGIDFLGAGGLVGWREYFLTVPIGYAWSEVNIIDNTVEALTISPRRGMP
jgi:hypothetical protein